MGAAVDMRFDSFGRCLMGFNPVYAYLEHSENKSGASGVDVSSGVSRSAPPTNVNTGLYYYHTVD